jgi:hypothetical protein
MTEAEQIMKRCQVGTRNYDEANNLHADCYRVIGKLLKTIAELESQKPVAYCEIHHLPEPCVQCEKEHEGYNTAPPQRTEQNFCPRCGKRTNDIHTCTPPQENT